VLADQPDSEGKPVMSSLTIALITFCCVFGCALLGLFLGTLLPEHHRTNASKETVQSAAGLIATMVAIVLGMLVSSAKNSFDEMSSGITQMGAKTIQLDQVLAHYGPESKEIRNALRGAVISVARTIWPEDVSGHADLTAIEKSNTAADLLTAMRKLDPQTDAQRQIKSQALQISGELMNLRWMMIEQLHKSLPHLVLVVLASWLAMLFASFGLFAHRNATVVTALAISAMSVSGAVFLIIELNSPLNGMIKVSAEPLYKALEFIGK
jgi:hypothetical protein